MTANQQLFVYRSESLSNESALQAFVAAVDCVPTAMVYTPRRCLFARVGATGVLKNHQGEHSDFEDAYEVRAFCETAELRWRSDQTGATTAAVLSSVAVALPTWSKEERPVTGVIGQSYLLWGEGTNECKDEWSQLATARIGALWVPLANVQKRQLVLLKATEYLATDDVHGNTYVFEERLTGFQLETKAAG